MWGMIDGTSLPLAVIGVHGFSTPWGVWSPQSISDFWVVETLFLSSIWPRENKQNQVI